MSTVEASLCEARISETPRIASSSLLRAKALRRRREDDDYSKMSILQKIVARCLEKPEARGQ